MKKKDPLMNTPFGVGVSNYLITNERNQQLFCLYGDLYHYIVLLTDENYFSLQTLNRSKQIIHQEPLEGKFNGLIKGTYNELYMMVTQINGSGGFSVTSIIQFDQEGKKKWEIGPYQFIKREWIKVIEDGILLNAYDQFLSQQVVFKLNHDGKVNYKYALIDQPYLINNDLIIFCEEQILKLNCNTGELVTYYPFENEMIHQIYSLSNTFLIYTDLRIILLDQDLSLIHIINNDKRVEEVFEVKGYIYIIYYDYHYHLYFINKVNSGGNFIWEKGPYLQVDYRGLYDDGLLFHYTNLNRKHHLSFFSPHGNERWVIESNKKIESYSINPQSFLYTKENELTKVIHTHYNIELDHEVNPYLVLKWGQYIILIEQMKRDIVISKLTFKWKVQYSLRLEGTILKLDVEEANNEIILMLENKITQLCHIKFKKRKALVTWTYECRDLSKKGFIL